MDRLPPGVGAAPERPPQGPVASLGVGLERLRQLGWQRSEYYEKMALTFSGIFIVMVVSFLLIYMVFADQWDMTSGSCLPLWVLFWALSLLVAFWNQRLSRRTQGMLTRRVTAPSGSELRKAAETAMTAVGFRYSWVAPTQGFHAYKMPDLGAELLVGEQTDSRDDVTATTLHLGPVTADNVGGVVRLAEAMEHHLRAGRV